MALRLSGSLVSFAVLLCSVRGSPPLHAKAPFQVLQAPLQREEAEMLDDIWAKYSQGLGFINLQQLNSLLKDTDQEQGEQVITHSWWHSLCKEFNVDPSKGISKQNLAMLYRKSESSSIKRDYVRIFLEGAPPTKAARDLIGEAPMAKAGRNLFVENEGAHLAGRKNLLLKSGKQLTDDQMFDAIWMKYSQGQKHMTLPQLNWLLRDTDHEHGEQVLSEAYWQSLLKEMGAEFNAGLSKEQVLSLYAKNPGSSVMRDYIRIFVEGAPPSRGQDAEHTIAI